jgi:hypothetical protein
MAEQFDSRLYLCWGTEVQLELPSYKSEHLNQSNA